MLRLEKDFGWTLVLAAGLLIPVRELPAQSATTTPGMRPEATATQGPSSARSTAVKPSTGTSSKTGVHHKRAKPDPVAEVPQPPPPPPTLEQTPPTAPRITYQNGLLSIDAHNSTLSQVLRAVQLQTGASMEMPSTANNERVVTELGPGQPKDVLNSLLNGSKFDYIILGVTGNPGAVQRVILTPRQNQGANNVNIAQNNNQMPNQEPVEEEAQPDETVSVPEVEAENPAPEQPPPPPAGGFRRPMMVPPGQQDPNQAAGNSETPNGVKTPEQLMQELQQMQQQQQQYQQQLNPANQNPQ